MEAEGPGKNKMHAGKRFRLGIKSCGQDRRESVLKQTFRALQGLLFICNGHSKHTNGGQLKALGQLAASPIQAYKGQLGFVWAASRQTPDSNEDMIKEVFMKNNLQLKHGLELIPF